MMVEEVLFFSFLCCVFCPSLIALPGRDFEAKETLAFECPGSQIRNPMTLYDHATGVFTTYHDISGCDPLLFQGEELGLLEGRWVYLNSVYLFFCPSDHLLCDMFNPGIPYKKSVHVDFGIEYQIVGLSFRCHDGIYFTRNRLNDDNGRPYSNFVYFTNTECTFWPVGSNGNNNPIVIPMGKLTSVKSPLSGKSNHLFAAAPEVSSDVVEGPRYIFKISVPFTDSLIYAVEACLKYNPNGECIDYEFHVRSKGNSDMISFPISKNSIKADAYVEINYYTISYVGNVDVFHRLGITHRANERILEAYRGRIFQKASAYEAMNVHVLECEDDNDSCDIDEIRNFDVTVYGVAIPQDANHFYIQGVKIKESFGCNQGSSQCSVSVSMEKNRHTTLEYRRDESFLGLLMADSNSYTGVFKDISITAVAEEETYY